MALNLQFTQSSIDLIRQAKPCDSSLVHQLPRESELSCQKLTVNILSGLIENKGKKTILANSRLRSCTLLYHRVSSGDSPSDLT